MPWYAIHTKRCQEKRAAENLNAWGIETLAPWVTPQPPSPFPRPLFPGYIFARCDPASMLHNVHFTRGVSSIVSFGGGPAVVMDEVIAAIRSRIDDCGRVACEPRPLKAGDAVIIETGPLRNFQGVFERDLSDGERVRILLETVAYSAHAEIPRSEVAKLKVGAHSMRGNREERSLEAGA